MVTIPRTVLVRFLQNEDTIRILANPRLRAAEGKKTNLRIGTEVPIPVTTFTATQAGTSTFAPATSFNYKNVGRQPGDHAARQSERRHHAGDGRGVQHHRRRPQRGHGRQPAQRPTFLTRKVTGTLRLHDGETTLLGGLLAGIDTDTFAGILGVQSIPILNKIFTSREKSRDEQEIMMSITPHLVRAPKVTEADLQSVLIGTRELTRMGAGARPQLGVPEDQLAPPVGVTPSPVAPAAPTPAPPLGGPAPGSLSPPVPPPGAPPIIPPASGVGPPAGVAPPVQPAPSPSPSPIAGVPDAEGPASIGGSPGDVPPASRPGPGGPAGAPGGVAAAVLSPAEIRIPVGGTGTVGLVVMGAQDLRGVDMTVTFDPAVLEAQDVAPGPLLTLDGSPVGVNRGMESGRVRAQFTRVSGSAGSGVVATVTFRALRAGVVTATVEALSLTTGTSTTRVPVAAVTRIRVAQ